MPDGWCVLQAVAEAPLWPDRSRHARLVGVLLDHLELLDAVPLQLPSLRDPRAVAVAEAILANPGASTQLTVLAHAAGAGVRTIERLFRAEAAMTVQQWRTRARLVHALGLLASGASVAGAAMASGYSSPSAFGVAFRTELGVPPKRYLTGP